MKTKLNETILDIPDDVVIELIQKYGHHKTGWDVEDGDTFYAIINGNIHELNNFNLVERPFDKQQYDVANVFSTRELAEDVLLYQIYERQIWRRISEICSPIDWKNHDEDKWIIIYDHGNNRIEKSAYITYQTGEFVCDTKEHADQIIKEFKNELTWMFKYFGKKR